MKKKNFPLRVAAVTLAAMMTVPMVDYSSLRTRVYAENGVVVDTDSHTTVRNMNDYVSPYEDEEAYAIKGSGTIEDPYTITNECQFETLTNNIIAGNDYSGKYIVQTCDLDMSLLADYQGMDLNKYNFAGTYDGCGHVINIEFSDISYNGSIFSKVTGEVKNLGFAGRIKNSCQASITGYLAEEGSLLNLWSTVDFLNEDSAANYAMFAYDSESGSSILNCVYKGSIRGGVNKGIADGSASVRYGNYMLESGSTAVNFDSASGIAVDDISAATLNRRLAYAEDLDGTITEYEDITGEDFSFKGNIGRLSSISYTYTNTDGEEVTKNVEDFNAYSREYTVNLTDADTSKEIKVNGVALDLAGEESVEGDTVTLGDENDVRAVIKVNTSATREHAKTSNVTKYYIDFTANEDVEIENNSFEDGLESWETNNDDAISIEDGGIDGSKCLKIDNGKVETYNYYSQKVQLKPDTNYVLTGYVKSEGTYKDDGAAIDVEGGYGYEYDQEDNWLRGTNDWTKVRVYFTTSYTGEVEVRCKVGDASFSSIGTGYFDDINIEELEYPGDETVHRVLYEEENIVAGISKGIVNKIGMDNYKKFADVQQETYEAEADLLGSTPFNGAKIYIINDNQPIINNYGGIGDTNPVKYNYDQYEHFKRFSEGGSGSFAWPHELGHVFDKTHTNNSENLSFDFHVEFSTNMQMLYALDAVEGLSVTIGDKGLKFTSADEIAEYYKEEASGGYDNFIKNGKFTTDYMDGLTYVFIQVKDVTGWEPFKQTFRKFVNGDINTESMENYQIFDALMSSVQECYNPGGTEVVDAIGQDVYNMIMKGLGYPGKNVKDINYAVINKDSDDFCAYISNGRKAGKYNCCNTIKGIKIDLPGDDSIYYRGYVDNQWTDWMSDGDELLANKSGTIQAIQIKLGDELAEKYDVCYKTDNKYHGSLGWTANGQTAGDMSGFGAIESLTVTIVEKGTAEKVIDSSEPACKNEVASTGYIYFKNTDNWSTPYVYMWNSSTDKEASWPGSKMELVDAENNIWRYKYNGSYANCIFSNKGDSQTADLTCGGIDYIYTKNSNSWSEYENADSSATLFVEYVDEDGNTIADKEVFKGTVGENVEGYDASKNIEGYTLKEVNGNTTGKYVAKLDTIRRVYSKVVLHTNEWVKTDNNWSYYDAEGKAVTDWNKISGKWYYFNTDGVMQKGWNKLSSKWYYFDGNGAMQTGWKKLSGKWYYFNGNGAMQTGWKKLSGNWYYFGTDGKMVVNTTMEIGGVEYTFDKNGVMA